MDQKTDVMLSLAVAMGANCIPCFDHLYVKAGELGVQDHEIKRIVEIADKVKNGASIFLKNAIHSALDESLTSEQPCCSGQKNTCC